MLDGAGYAPMPATSRRNHSVLSASISSLMRPCSCRIRCQHDDVRTELRYSDDGMRYVPLVHVSRL